MLTSEVQVQPLELLLSTRHDAACAEESAGVTEPHTAQLGFPVLFGQLACSMSWQPGLGSVWLHVLLKFCSLCSPAWIS